MRRRLLWRLRRHSEGFIAFEDGVVRGLHFHGKVGLTRRHFHLEAAIVRNRDVFQLGAVTQDDGHFRASEVNVLLRRAAAQRQLHRRLGFAWVAQRHFDVRNRAFINVNARRACAVGHARDRWRSVVVNDGDRARLRRRLLWRLRRHSEGFIAFEDGVVRGLHFHGKVGLTRRHFHLEAAIVRNRDVFQLGAVTQDDGHFRASEVNVLLRRAAAQRQLHRRLGFAWVAQRHFDVRNRAFINVNARRACAVGHARDRWRSVVVNDGDRARLRRRLLWRLRRHSEGFIAFEDGVVRGLHFHGKVGLTRRHFHLEAAIVRNRDVFQLGAVTQDDGHFRASEVNVLLRRAAAQRQLHRRLGFAWVAQRHFDVRNRAFINVNARRACAVGHARDRWRSVVVNDGDRARLRRRLLWRLRRHSEGFIAFEDGVVRGLHFHGKVGLTRRHFHLEAAIVRNRDVFQLGAVTQDDGHFRASEVNVLLRRAAAQRQLHRRLGFAWVAQRHFDVRNRAFINVNARRACAVGHARDRWRSVVVNDGDRARLRRRLLWRLRRHSEGFIAFEDGVVRGLHFHGKVGLTRRHFHLEAAIVRNRDVFQLGAVTQDDGHFRASEVNVLLRRAAAQRQLHRRLGFAWVAQRHFDVRNRAFINVNARRACAVGHARDRWRSVVVNDGDRARLRRRLLWRLRRHSEGFIAFEDGVVRGLHFHGKVGLTRRHFHLEAAIVRNRDVFQLGAVTQDDGHFRASEVNVLLRRAAAQRQLHRRLGFAWVAQRHFDVRNRAFINVNARRACAVGHARDRWRSVVVNDGDRARLRRRLLWRLRRHSEGFIAFEDGVVRGLHFHGKVGLTRRHFHLEAAIVRNRDVFQLGAVTQDDGHFRASEVNVLLRRAAAQRQLHRRLGFAWVAQRHFDVRNRAFINVNARRACAVGHARDRWRSVVVNDGDRARLRRRLLWRLRRHSEGFIAFEDGVVRGLHFHGKVGLTRRHFHLEAAIVRNRDVFQLGAVTQDDGHFRASEVNVLLRRAAAQRQLHRRLGFAWVAQRHFDVRNRAFINVNARRACAVGHARDRWRSVVVNDGDRARLRRRLLWRLRRHSEGFIAFEDGVVRGLHFHGKVGLTRRHFHLEAAIVRNRDVFQLGAVTQDDGHFRASEVNVLLRRAAAQRQLHRRLGFAWVAQRHFDVRNRAFINVNARRACAVGHARDRWRSVVVNDGDRARLRRRLLWRLRRHSEGFIAFEDGVVRGLHFHGKVGLTRRHFHLEAAIVRNRDVFQLGAVTQDDGHFRASEVNVLLRRAAAQRQLHRRLGLLGLLSVTLMSAPRLHQR